MAGHLGPGERWPTHSRPEARDALREAAAAGWYFRESAGHAFGRITCPHIGQLGACTVVIFSTSGPADGSETAKAIRRGLRKCPHVRDTEPDDPDLHERLTDEEITRRVERLLRAVDGLDRRSQADAALDDAIDRDDITAFEEQHQRLVDGDNAAQTAWSELGRPLAPWPPAVARKELLDDAERFASSVEDGEVARRLRASIDALRG